MTKDEQFQLELSTLLETYRSLKSEIVSNLDSSRQVSTLTLTAVGIFIATAQSMVQAEATIIFLIAPLLFYVFAWSQLRYTFLVLDMGAHLRDVVAPKVHEILQETQTITRDISYIMSWELQGKGPSGLRRRRTILQSLAFLPIAGANFGIPLIAATLSVFSFLFFTFQNSRTISAIEGILIVVDVIGLLYSAYWGWIAERSR
jgi:hypothetical protein